MNNKGFTLAELLAVIVILAVIMIVAAPNLSKQFNKKEETEQNVLNQKIENASKVYVAKYYANKVVNGTESIEFTLSDLEKDGLINLSKNSSCNMVKNSNIIVTVNSKVNFKYDSISNNNKCYKLN